MADTIRGLAADTLDKVLYELSCQMKTATPARMRKTA